MVHLLLGHFSQVVQRYVVKAFSLEPDLARHLNQKMVEWNVMALFSMKKSAKWLIVQVSKHKLNNNAL